MGAGGSIDQVGKHCFPLIRYRFVGVMLFNQQVFHLEYDFLLTPFGT